MDPSHNPNTARQAQQMGPFTDRTSQVVNKNRDENITLPTLNKQQVKFDDSCVSLKAKTMKAKHTKANLENLELMKPPTILKKKPNDRL